MTIKRKCWKNWRTITYVVFFCLPLVSIQHFIYPLSWCVISDICNHTWRPECGYDHNLSEYKLFTDECDMYEYNCDNFRDYELVNYKECLVASTICPTSNCPKCGDENKRNIIRNQIRRYNSKENIFKRMMQNQFATELWALKKEMKGRRHTPEIMKLHKLLRKMTVTQATVKPKVNKSEIKKNTIKRRNTIKGKAKTDNNLFTRIIKKETVHLDGKLMMKIVKGTTIANK